MRDVLIAMASGLAFGLPVDVIYAAALQLTPILFVHGLGSLTVGLVIGLVVAPTLFKRKVRNVAVSLAAVGTVAAVCYYVHWVAWEAILLRSDKAAPSPVALAGRPDQVFQIAARCYENGTWRLKNGPTDNSPPTKVGPFVNPPITYGGRTRYEPVSGPSLGLIWLAEAAALIGIPLSIAWAFLRETPFCEACDRWCAGPTVLRRSTWTDPTAVRRELEAGQFATVAALPPPTNSGKFIEFSQYRCDKCARLNTLSAVAHIQRADNRGNVRGSRKRSIVRNLLIPPEALDAFRA